MIESVLDLYRFAGIFGDIEEHEIIFFQIIPQEEECVERLRQDVDILRFQEIPVDGVDDVHRLLIQIHDIQSEEYFAGLPYDMFLLFAVDMHAIDIDHDPFSVHVVMLLRRLAFLFYDILEILIGEFFSERLENIEPEKGEPAFIQHEVMGIFGIFSGFVGYLHEILMKNVLQNLILFADFVDTETRVRFGKMFVSDVEQKQLRII